MHKGKSSAFSTNKTALLAYILHYLLDFLQGLLTACNLVPPGLGDIASVVGDVVPVFEEAASLIWDVASVVGDAVPVLGYVASVVGEVIYLHAGVVGGFTAPDVAAAAVGSSSKIAFSAAEEVAGSRCKQTQK